MGQWVVTVAGIAILSVLCDVILPEGQTRKYIKTVFGVVVTLVLVSPLVGLLQNDLLPSSAEQPTLQYQYIESVADRQQSNAEKSILLALEANDIRVKSLSVADGRVTVLLEGHPSDQIEQVVRHIVNNNLPNCEVVTLWVELCSDAGRDATPKGT